MGQKVHPIGIRLGISKDWNSTWYANKSDYAALLISDLEVRAFLQQRLAHAAVSRIQIERPAKSARITIHTARPGIVIGKKGEDIETLRREVTELMGVPTHITVAEIRKPELDAQLVAEGISQQLERRIMSISVEVDPQIRGELLMRLQTHRAGDSTMVLVSSGDTESRSTISTPIRSS
jgi:small subunit ribosomal protein S3